MTPDQIESLDDLRRFIHRELCSQENLLEDQFSLSETSLKSGGRVCAVQFVLWGPRSIRLAAIWSCDTNVVYFYDTQGQRYDKLALEHWLPAPGTSTGETESSAVA